MTRVLLFFLCTLAVPALGFEGVIDTKMTVAGGKDLSMSGTGTITIKGVNFRMDTEMSLPTGSTKMTSIARAEEPGITYILNDRSKTYTKLDSKHDGPD